MKTLIIPPDETPLSFCVMLGGIGGSPHQRKDTASEAMQIARELADANIDVRVFREVAFTVDPCGNAVHHGTAGESPATRPDVRDVLIRRLVTVLNRAGMEVLEERMPSLIDISEALIEAKSLGYAPANEAAAASGERRDYVREIAQLENGERVILPKTAEHARSMMGVAANALQAMGEPIIPVKYPDTQAGRELRVKHAKDREFLREQHQRERNEQS